MGGNTYDFSGLGNNDVSNALSDQAAQALLDIQQNYGSAYIQQRLADLKQSDPNGYAARQQLFDKILADAQASPDRPIATDLQTQINEELSNAGQLDSRARQQIQNQVRGGQVASGIYLGNAPAAQETSAMVNAQDQLRSQQQQQASSYLQSGVSPEDVQYRRIQQSLSNLGAFTNGQTPTAQFGSLSAAGNGAAPQTPTGYQTPSAINPNAAAQGVGFANQAYGQNLSYLNNQTNPWLAGLTLGVNTMGAYNSFASPYGGSNGATYGSLSPDLSSTLSEDFPEFSPYNSASGAGSDFVAASAP